VYGVHKTCDPSQYPGDKRSVNEISPEQLAVQKRGSNRQRGCSTWIAVPSRAAHRFYLFIEHPCPLALGRCRGCWSEVRGARAKSLVDRVQGPTAHPRTRIVLAGLRLGEARLACGGGCCSCAGSGNRTTGPARPSARRAGSGSARARGLLGGVTS
jgi:hypothetical protein